MTALKLWRHWVDAAVVFIAVTAMVAAPWLVADTADDPGEYLLVGFLGVMGGYALAVGVVALGQILDDARRSARG